MPSLILRCLVGLWVCGPIMLGMAQAQQKGDAVAEKPRQEQAMRDAVTRWQAILGPVKFDEPLSTCMTYLDPEPMSDFLPLGDKRLSKDVEIMYRVWIGSFFKGEFPHAVANFPATKYYLRQSGKTEFDDLLLHEGSYEEESISTMESSNAFLVTIRPKDYQPERGLEANDIAQILFDRLRLPYATIENLKQAFELQGVAKLGSVFMNNPKITKMEIVYLRGWADCVFVFVGKDGLSVFLFKAQAGRAKVGLPLDPDWLKKGLH